jgi:hypothetical protein
MAFDYSTLMAPCACPDQRHTPMEHHGYITVDVSRDRACGISCGTTRYNIGFDITNGTEAAVEDMLLTRLSQMPTAQISVRNLDNGCANNGG